MNEMSASNVQTYCVMVQRRGNTSLTKYRWYVKFVNERARTPNQAAGRLISVVGANDDTVLFQ